MFELERSVLLSVVIIPFEPIKLLSTCRYMFERVVTTALLADASMVLILDVVAMYRFVLPSTIASARTVRLHSVES